MTMIKTITCFLLFVMLQSIVVEGNDDTKFMCIKDFSMKIESRWNGNVKYVLNKQLITSFKDWTVEIHFDQPLSDLKQWTGQLDSSTSIVHEKGRVFFIKAQRKAEETLKSLNLRIVLIATYDGILEPKLVQAALCGYTSTSAVYPTQPPVTEVLPTLPLVSRLPSCDNRVIKQWHSGSKQVLTIPINSETSSWILELKFNAPWKEFKQWSCDLIADGNNSYICHNKIHNGRQAAGSKLEFEYLMNIANGNAPVLLEAWFGDYHCKN